MKKEKLCLYILGLLFVVFIALYISQATGYYEYQNHQTMILTKEKISEFEKDIENGKNVDITDYVGETRQNYNNPLSNLGNNISISLQKSIQRGLSTIFKVIEKSISND